MSETESTQDYNFAELNRIQLGYSGIMADRMEWLKPALAKFESSSDLRTSVVIRNDDPHERNEINQLGDTLAFKRVADLGEIFRKKETSKFLEVSTNLANGRAEIVIYDQILARHQERERKIDESSFIKAVDSLTKEGLYRVLFEEKKAMAILSGKFLSPLAPIIAISSAQLILAADNIFNLLQGSKGSLESSIVLLLVSIGGYALNTFYAKRGMEKVFDKVIDQAMKTDLKYWPIQEDEKIDIGRLNPLRPLLRIRDGKKDLGKFPIVTSK